MITRQGNGITLFIDEKSNYGLSQYTPIQPDHYMYNFYLREKNKFDNDKNYVFFNKQTNKTFTREETEKIIHCLGCNASKMNNCEKYCQLCDDYYNFWD